MNNRSYAESIVHYCCVPGRCPSCRGIYIYPTCEKHGWRVDVTKIELHETQNHLNADVRWFPPSETQAPNISRGCIRTHETGCGLSNRIEFLARFMYDHEFGSEFKLHTLQESSSRGRVGICLVCRTGKTFHALFVYNTTRTLRAFPRPKSSKLIHDVRQVGLATARRRGRHYVVGRSFRRKISNLNNVYERVSQRTR